MGSPVSIISKNTFDKLRLSMNSLSEVLTTLKSVNGTDVKDHGQIKLKFSISNKVFVHDFIVAETFETDAILGMDFLEAYEADIKVAQRLMFVKGYKIRLYKLGFLACAHVKLAEKVRIEPQAEITIKGQIFGPNLNSMSVFEPRKDLNRKGLMLARTFCKESDSRIVINAVNLTNESLYLDQHSLLGKLDPVDEVKPIDFDNEDQNISDDITLPEHLKCLVENASTELSLDQKLQLKKCIFEYQDIFTAPDGKLGRTDIVKHSIDTGNSKPIRVPPRRVPISQRVVIENEIDKMLKNDVIEPSTSAWSSPILLVKKRDNTVRFCVDYRQLNAVTKKDAYPLPRIDTSLDALGGNKWFCTIDLTSGYWQCEMSPESKEKTSFSSHKGLYQFKVLPFGLCNAPATFERLVELVLKGYQWEYCLCYLDDVIIFGDTFEKTLTNLKLVFDRFRLYNLKLKPSKCSMFQTQVLFLGHVVTDKGISCDPSKVDTIKNWPVPTSVAEVKSFLGLAGYYRKFIPNFSEIASPLTSLTKKARKFEWSDDCQKGFDKLKELLITSPILSYPMEEGEYILDTDASGNGIGGVLSQIQNGQEKVIAYSSKTLNESQRRYCTTYKELLAVVTFVKQFRHYLFGRHFKVRTDHASLIWLKNFKNPEGIVARWISVLDTYDMVLEHRRGSLHVNADSLSRRPHKRCIREDCPDCTNTILVSANNDENCKTEAVHQVLAPIQVQPPGLGNNQDTSDEDTFSTVPNWLSVWSDEQIAAWQSEDPDIKKVLELKKTNIEKPFKQYIQGCSHTVRMFWNLWDRLFVQNEILYYIYLCENSENKALLVAPHAVRIEILKHLHDSRIAGHLGREKTLESVKRRFFWPGMSTDVRNWCKSCNECAQAKAGPGCGRFPLQQSATGCPFDRVAVDIVGPCPVSENGNEYLIVMTDYFSKWTEAFAVPNHTAMTVADKLVTEVFCRFGVPSQLHSDQGREFESELFANVCNLLGIEKTRTCPYRPQSDGLVERMNRTIIQMMSIFVNENRNNWDDHLPFILMAYRATIQDSTCFSPYKMLFGRDMICPIDIICGFTVNSVNLCPIEYVEWLRFTLTTTYNFAYENLSRAASRQKKNYDRGAKPRGFGEGSFVWRWYPPKAGIKLALGWTGPYFVEAKVSDVLYKIKLLPTSKSLIVHVDHLKPYAGRNVPDGWQSEIPDFNVNHETELDEQSESDVDDELNLSDDHFESFEIANHSFDTPKSPFSVQDGNPVTPKRTRCGRQVKKPLKYSPSL